jgi:hypothetical protein
MESPGFQPGRGSTTIVKGKDMSNWAQYTVAVIKQPAVRFLIRQMRWFEPFVVRKKKIDSVPLKVK